MKTSLTCSVRLQRQYLLLDFEVIFFVKIQRLNCTVFHKVYSSRKKIKMPPLCVKTFEITNDKVPSDETIFLTKIMRLFIEACFITWNCICDMLVIFQYLKSMFWVPKKYYNQIFSKMRRKAFFSTANCGSKNWGFG